MQIRTLGLREVMELVRDHIMMRQACVFSVYTCAIQNSTHSPHVALECLKDGWCEGGTEFVILFKLKKLIFNSVIGKLPSVIGKVSSMFATTWVSKATFSTVNFTKPKYLENTPNGNVAFELE